MTISGWLRGLCLVLAGTALALVSGLAPAVAQLPVSDAEPVDHVVLIDQVRDVWKFGPGEDPGTPVGARPTVDITRSRAWHGGGTVGMRLRFVDLRRTAHDEVLQAIVRTPRQSFVAFVTMGPGDRGGTHTLMQTDGTPVTCTGMRHSVSYADDRIALRIPRACLERPAWVRLKIIELLHMPGTPDESPYSFVDNPHNATGHPTFTPRLYRG